MNHYNMFLLTWSSQAIQKIYKIFGRYSKFVLYRLRAFNGESGNLNQDTMNIMVKGREIANNSYMTCKYSHRF